MKAIIYQQYGLPEVLKLADVAKPHPGDHEVLVNLKAVSINAWDWDTLTGKPREYRLFNGLFKPRHSLIHGCDIAGIVEQVGNKVRQFRVGDLVFGDIGERGWGAFAEYVCAREDALIHKPSSMSFEQAACLPHAGNLAVQGLIDHGRIRGCPKVLINGGGGSTGTLAIQMAKHFGAEVTGVDNHHKQALMKSLGADYQIDYTTTDFTQAGQRYDLIFDVKTTRPLADYRRALGPGGRYITVGGQTSRLLKVALFGNRQRACSMRMVLYKANKDLGYLVELFETQQLKPIIDRSFPLEQTADAFDYYGSGQAQGKIVVTN